MPLPQMHKRIVSDIRATVTRDDRAALAGYLEEIHIDEELFRRKVKQAAEKLIRFNEQDVKWLQHWLPIIERTLDEN